MAIRLTIAGCCGRMGHTIASLASTDSRVKLAAAFERAGHESIGRDLGSVLGLSQSLGIMVTDNARLACSQGEVVIDFTHPDPTLHHIQIAQELHKPIVIGTTGFSSNQLEIIKQAARDIAIVLSPNMSVGVNVLFELVREAAGKLGIAYDVEIVESHHRHKQDAPSGTAKRLADSVAQARGQSVEKIPVHALRAGDIVGDHTVLFAGSSERLELTHRAHSRKVFAQGALRAALFLHHQPPGLYDMSHVLKAVTGD